MAVYITTDECSPENEETLRTQILIGKRLTKVEIRDSGAVVLSFDPFGEITTTIFQDFRTSILADDHPYRKLPEVDVMHYERDGKGVDKKQ